MSNQWYSAKIESLKASEAAETSGADSSQRYHENHQKRFLDTVGLVGSLVDDSAAILDFGRSGLTVELYSRFKNLTTIGFPLDQDDGGHREQTPLDSVPHIDFDLRNAEFVETWPAVSNTFDLITFCEVIEHIPIAPEFQILFLTSLLKPGGKLIITTPNGAGWYQRARLLRGKSASERIRFNSNNPGHFREYTPQEIAEWANICELSLEKLELKNYVVDYPNKLLTLPRRFKSFKDTVIAVYSKK